jgi:hypothetical protein
MKHNQHKSKQNRAVYGETIKGNPMYGMYSFRPIIGYTSAKETHENRMPNWAKLNNKG